MRKALWALAGFAIPALAAQYTLEIRPEATKVAWTLNDVLHTVHGTFQLKSGQITFDTATGQASGQVVVDVASGGSGGAARDQRMHANVLESAKYPEAVFRPDRIDGRIDIPGDASVKLHGIFTIHGAAHEISMDVRAKSSGNRMDVTLTFAVPYVAWGMKDPSNFVLKVEKTVQVTVESAALLTKQ